MSADGIILVTGGSRGIGAATATLLAEEGKRIVALLNLEWVRPRHGG